MESGAIATIPLGLLVLAGVVLAVTSLAIGWLASRARWQRKLSRFNEAETGRLRALLNALPFAALITDAEGNILADNKEAIELLAPFGRRDTVPLTVDAAIARVTRLRVAERLELLLPGLEQRLQISVAPLGAESHALVTFLNPETASDRAQVYQQLISAIGHELRTPLTAVMGHVDIINSCQMEEEALWRRSLHFVTAEVERLARLVEDWLHLSRLDLAPPYLRPSNLRLIAEEALSTLFDRAQENDVKLVLQAPDKLPRVQADPDRMRQVFLNLLDNGIKYAPGRTVTVKLAPEEKAVRVEVHDDGPGIAAEELDHLFKPFYRGRQNEAVPGTGMGLTIVKAILDQHQAPIQVQSQPGQGAQFYFSLPLARTG